ncbi:hypothetical protein TRP66_21570 [Pseudomonas sp. JDS28PS106]|uniref:hypothetical protein n=1 Tax=Pseudomonas sp. JDS28PS106 TaxID=2497235 RepID=UPI002FD12A59
MNTWRLGTMLAALSVSVCLAASADSSSNHGKNNADDASRSLTAPAPMTKQTEENRKNDGDTSATDPDSPRSMHRPSAPTPDAADLTDEEAEAIRKATQ